MIIPEQPQTEHTEMPKRLLSKQHISELQRRGKGIREGWLHIKIHNGEAVAIADTRIHNLVDLDTML